VAVDKAVQDIQAAGRKVWFGPLGKHTCDALIKSIYLSTFVSFLIVIFFDIFTLGSPQTINGLPQVIGLGLFGSVFVAVPFVLYASATALPLYKFMALRMGITFPACLVVGTFLAAPLPLAFGSLPVNALFALAGFMAGGLFYLFDQVAPARKALKAVKQH
jgi:hypothetical protein